MNSIVLIGEILTAPEMRYTTETLAVASMLVQFPSTRSEEAPLQIRVSVFGDMAQTLVGQCTVGQQVIVEGQLHINSIERDGRNEKRAEINARRIHPVGGESIASPAASQTASKAPPSTPVVPTPVSTVIPSPKSSPAPRPTVDYDEVPF